MIFPQCSSAFRIAANLVQNLGLRVKRGLLCGPFREKAGYCVTLSRCEFNSQSCRELIGCAVQSWRAPRDNERAPPPWTPRTPMSRAKCVWFAAVTVLRLYFLFAYIIFA